MEFRCFTWHDDVKEWLAFSTNYSPFSSSSSILQSSSNGLLALPVTQCFKCATCLASNFPDLGLFASFSKSVLLNWHSSLPVLGNFSGSGIGFRENFFVDHFNQDFICKSFHSKGSGTIH